MPQFTLSQIAKAADEQFGEFIIPDVPGGPVALVNVLRLPKDRRDKFEKAQSQQGTTLTGQLDALRQMVYAVAKTKAEADRLLKAFGDDYSQIAALLTEYGQATNAGEA